MRQSKSSSELTNKQRYGVRRYVRSLADRSDMHGEPRDELIRLMVNWTTAHGYEDYRKIKRVARDAAELHAWLQWQQNIC